MLPGFKLVVATIILSVSVLIFGLGAAALLRSAHDDFVSIPSWRTAQPPKLTPGIETARIETPRPSLSLARIDPAPVQPDARKADQPKLAAIDPKTATDVAANVTEEAKPAIRKRRAAVKRKRIVRRARTTIAAQQQPIGSDPFGSFGNNLPLATPSRR